MSPVLKIVAGLASMPARLVAGQVQRLASGPQAVVDVIITSVDHALRRQALLHRLRRVITDPNVAAVLLRIQGPPGSWAASQDLRGAIEAIRRSGRAVYAWMEAPGNAHMWIASACDRVFVVPTAEVNLLGIGVELTFFGSALTRLGVEPDFEAAGTYKSFGESWTRSFASPANQEAVRFLVEDLQEQLIRGIAEGRRKEVAEVLALVQRGPLTAEDALDEGLIDGLMYEDQLEDWLQQHHGSRSKQIPFASWARRDAAREWIDQWGETGQQIAVLHLQGPIAMDDLGTGSPRIGARRVVPILAALRKNEDVQAVVLHINSPGGSALASDLIWREVEQLQRVKPVVASFEDVAASGGYYLAAPAVEILARQGTLTGSIGVFGGKLVAGEGLRRLGVHQHEITAAPNATMLSPSRPFTDDQRRRFRGMLQRFYDGFVQRVAAGRRRPEASLEPHCRGRVWTGQAARERGLVDRFGDLDDAVERARILAGMQVDGFIRRDYSTHRQTLMYRLAERAMREVAPGASVSWVAQAVGMRLSPAVDLVVQTQGEPLAMIPFDVELK